VEDMALSASAAAAALQALQAEYVAANPKSAATLHFRR
jgi:hypothetical protein